MGRLSASTNTSYASELFLNLASAPVVLLQLKRGGEAKAKGEGEKEKECATECKSRRRQDEKSPWVLNYESGKGGGDEKWRRRGGEELRGICVMWVAHGERAAVGVDVDAQGGGLGEDETHFPLTLEYNTARLYWNEFCCCSSSSSSPDAR